MMCRRQTRPSVARDLDIALVADMKVVMLTSDKVTAEAWDEYMNRFGIEAYVAARYFSAPTSARIAETAPDTSGGHVPSDAHLTLALVSGPSTCRGKSLDAFPDVQRSSWSTAVLFALPAASATAAIRMTKIRYDPPAEGTRLNREVVVIKNTGSARVTLTHWTLRNTSGDVFAFPIFRLRSGATVTIHTGQGSATGTTFSIALRIWNEVGDMGSRDGAEDRDGRDASVVFSSGGGASKNLRAPVASDRADPVSDTGWLVRAGSR